MTLNEFRAWFDGFSEAIGDAPTPEQWAKIKAKLAQARDPVVVPSVWPRVPTQYPSTSPTQYPSTSPTWPSTAPRYGDVTCATFGAATDPLSNIARN